jgi:MraZ protein
VFIGVTELTLDAKGRLAIPTKYRDAIQRICNGQMVVTLDADECLLLYPLPVWEEVAQMLVRLPNMERGSRSTQRNTLGAATESDLDANGRVLIPAPLREFAKIERDVIFTGLGKKFEIWDAARWKAQRDEWLVAAKSGAPVPPELRSLSL